MMECCRRGKNELVQQQPITHHKDNSVCTTDICSAYYIFSMFSFRCFPSSHSLSIFSLTLFFPSTFSFRCFPFGVFLPLIFFRHSLFRYFFCRHFPFRYFPLFFSIFSYSVFFFSTFSVNPHVTKVFKKSVRG
jgi:hypothetical protein